MYFLQGGVLQAAAGRCCVCGGHFDKVVPFVSPILKEEGGTCLNVLHIKTSF